MKNKFLILLVATMVAGVMLVGCATSDTNADANNTSETNTEISTEEFESTETEIVEITENEVVEETEITDTKETEVTVIETVNLEHKGTTGIETRYSNGTSDYEIWHTNAYNGASIHYKVKNAISGAALYNADNGTQALLQALSESTDYEGYKLYVCPQGSIESSKINLRNMSDKEVGEFAYSTYEVLYRTETDTMATAFVKYSKGDFICYDYYVNDYTTGQSWWYMIHATESCSSQETIEKLISGIEILD